MKLRNPEKMDKRVVPGDSNVLTGLQIPVMSGFVKKKLIC